METLTNKEVIESSSLFLDLTSTQLEKIDLFFSNTNLTLKQQKDLMLLFKEVYSQGYEQCDITNYEEKI